MRARKVFESVFWWIVTIITLFLLDDMVFGPIFWALSLASQLLATISAFSISIAVQQWLVREGTREQPAKLAQSMLAKLQLERKNSNVSKNEAEIRLRAGKYLGATLVAPLIGGVIPCLILSKKGFPRASVLRFSWIPTIIYATEFASIHGGWGFGAILRNLLAMG